MSGADDSLALGFVTVEKTDSMGPSEDVFVQDVLAAARKDMADQHQDSATPDKREARLAAQPTRVFKDAVITTKDEASQLIPNLMEALYYGQQDTLSMAFDRVKERPYLDSSIDERKKRFSDALNNAQYAGVHPVAAKAERLIQDARQCAAEAKASVFNACEVLDKIQPVFKDTCMETMEEFTERQDSKEKLEEYHRCQEQRQVQLREFNVEAADQLQATSIQHLGEAVDLAEEFSAEVDQRVDLMREQNHKETHAECSREVKDVIYGERDELRGYGRQCRDDITVLKETLAEQERRASHMNDLHEIAAQDVSERKAKNKRQQEDLERRLQKLREEQTQLEQEEAHISEWHVEVKEVLREVDSKLVEKKTEMESLESRVDASLRVIGLMEDCTNEVIAVAEEMLARNQHSLHRLQTAASFQLRQSLLASAVAFSARIKDCKTNIGILKKKYNEQMAEMKASAKSGLTMYVKKLKEENGNLVKEIKRYQEQLKEHEAKLNEVTGRLEVVDGKLKELDPKIDLPSVQEKVEDYERMLMETWDGDELESLSSVGVLASLKSM